LLQSCWYWRLRSPAAAEARRRGTPSGGGSTGEYTHQIVEVSPQKLDDMIQTDADLIIVDVSGKWADGHLVGALDVPLDTLQTTINNTFSLSSGKHYVVYSHDEESSKKAPRCSSTAHSTSSTG